MECVYKEHSNVETTVKDDKLSALHLRVHVGKVWILLVPADEDKAELKYETYHEKPK